MQHKVRNEREGVRLGEKSNERASDRLRERETEG